MGALSHLRVLDLSRVLAGPWAGQILADLGAEVIKVERPGNGDDTRAWGPPFLKDAYGENTSEAAYYLSANRGKRSVAVNLASQVDEAAVILEGAPASIVAIGQQRYPFFPIRYLIRNPFESIARIAQVKSPLLFLHSPEDTVIPIAEGRRLFEAAPPPKQFVEVEGGHVFASERDPRFFPAVRSFLHAHRLLP